MANDYAVRVYTPAGVLLAEITRFVQLQYVLTENAVGALSLTTAEEIPYAWYARDTRLEVWRSIDGGRPYLEGGAVWFVRKYQHALAQDGSLTHTLTAYDAKHLLGRRVIAYYAGSAQASKTAHWDDMMKAIVRENLGALATDTTRDLSAYLSVAADASVCTSDNKAFSYRNVLTVLQEIAEASAGENLGGTYLAFDIVKAQDVNPMLEFRTYPYWRGQDHRYPAAPAPVLVSPENGTLADTSVYTDASQELTAAYGGGAGQGAARYFGTGWSSNALASPFNRCEVFGDYANDTTAQIAAALTGLLWYGRPHRVFSGTLLDTAGDTNKPRYGRDYVHGDVITASFANQLLNVRVNPVTVTADAAGEQVQVALNGDTLIDE